MPLPPEFRVTETADSIRIEWDNGALERDGCSGPFFKLFWLPWVAASVWLTGQWVWFLFRVPPDRVVDTYCCLPFFALMSWFVTWITTQVLLSRNWFESVEVTRHAITHTFVGRWAPSPSVYPLDHLDVVAFGWDREKPERHPTDDFKEAAIYIVPKNGKPLSMIGQWVEPQVKSQMFELIREFLADNQRGVRTEVWGQPDPLSKC